MNALNGWHFVSDASNSGAQNSVDLQIGPQADMLQLNEYVENKKPVTT